MPTDPQTNLPSGAHEPWGWQRPQRVMLAILITIGLVILVMGWRRYSAPLPSDLQVKHTPVPELETLVDPNTATAASLSRIPGIGPTLAQRIVDYREQKMLTQKAPVFQKLTDLSFVSGIGKKTLENMRPWLKLADPPVLAPTGLQPAQKINPDAFPDED